MSDDRALRDRLVNLAAAVPVPPPSSASTLTRKPVTLGPALRGPVSRSWLPVALVAVLVVAAVGILASGSQPAYGPVMETVRQGDFELMLRAEKGRYEPDEPIKIEASLAYVGPEPSIEIGHAFGARQSAISFGIVEPVIGDLRLQPGWDTACMVSTLAPGAPLTVPFQKSGGYSGEGPRGSEQGPFMSDPVLRLEQGTWHVFAEAWFSIGDCSPSAYRLRAEIAITVEPSEAILSSPSEQANLPQSNTVRDGDFELTIRSGKTRYTTDEVVDVSASLVYRGPEAAVDVSGGLGQIWSRERSGEIVVGFEGAFIMICPGGTYEQGVPHEVSIVTARVTADGFEPQPVPRLPAGTWHLYAVAGTCGNPPPGAIEFALQAEITIEVVDDSAVTPGPSPQASPTLSPVPTDDATNTPVSNVDSSDGFQLTLTALHGRYRSGDPIEATILLENVGYAEAPFVLASSPLVALSATEASGELWASFGSNPGCEPFGYYERGQPTRLEFRMLSNYGVNVSAEWLRPFVEGPTFTLPSGTWTLTTRTVLFPQQCGEAVSDPWTPIQLQASVVVVVDP